MFGRFPNKSKGFRENWKLVVDGQTSLAASVQFELPSGGGEDVGGVDGSGTNLFPPQPKAIGLGPKQTICIQIYLHGLMGFELPLMVVCVLGRRLPRTFEDIRRHGA